MNDQNLVRVRLFSLKLPTLLGLVLLCAGCGCQQASVKSAESGPVPSINADAIKRLKALEQQYARLQTYSDQGELQSSGQGFMAKNARFETRFSRGGGFLFKEQALENGKPYDQNAVWSDGKRSWLYMEMVGGSAERGIADALSTISTTGGYVTMLVPALLMPNEFKGGILSETAQEITLEADALAGGAECSVLKVKKSSGMSLTLWIDKKSGLILKALEPNSGSTITYQPQVNVKLRAKDFVFVQPG